MDLSPDPTESDEIIQRYGRRLYVLAYHLTGEGAEADELTTDVLMRAVLAPDLPASEGEAGVFLGRLLIGMWKERLQSGDKGRGPRAVTPESRGHESLWRALSRLDPVSRAVLVLRLAEGLEYETIGKVLDMAPDVVYARLLQARAGLREGDRLVNPALFETMNLYLDARLPVVQRGEFERRIQSDSSLREQVEFHRGLTLELQEETPPLPRDFVTRVHGRIERARETLALVDQATLSAGWEPAAAAAPPARRRWPLVVAASVAAGVIVVLSVALLFALRRSPAAPGTAGAGSVRDTRPGDDRGAAFPRVSRPRQGTSGKATPRQAGRKRCQATEARAGRPGPLACDDTRAARRDTRAVGRDSQRSGRIRARRDPGACSGPDARARAARGDSSSTGAVGDECAVARPARRRGPGSGTRLPG
ncbi:MAG TPA: sigma factor-like helix-turn-helix DNA-binding protein, partial [Candidatus Dormibacteraeota bacterium]|nr:sigma factor-like helix-turn-helix DNA-binding protein [Candidatus Dormibacteraeota bacterium]